MKLTYQGCDKSGKTVSDTIEAANSAEAIERLRREGLYVTKIAAADGKSANDNRPAPARIGNNGNIKKNLMLFTRQFYLLTSTGTPILQALESLEQQTDQPGWREMIGSLREQVEDGKPLSEALKHHPQYFDPVYCSLINAGESSGKLSVMLERLSALTRKQMQVRNAVSGALVYPCLLIFISFLVMIMMLTLVLPRFEKMFQSLNTPLPPSTQVLMAVSNTMRTYWYIILAVVLVGGTGLRIWLKRESGKRTVDTVLLRLPQIGKIVRNMVTARIARLMGILLNSYVPMIETLELIGKSLSNHHYANLINEALDAVTRGDSVSTAFSKTDLIQPTVTEALRSGEQSGQMATSLVTIADFMDEENDLIVKSLSSILEPVILIIMGLIVGFMAVSMFMPLFDLTSAGG